MATRRESVVLTLEDRFSPGMAKAAVVTAALNRELNNLSGNSVKADRSTQVFVRDLNALSREAKGADRSINQLTGRLRLFADLAAILGPSLAPVGGVLTAGVAGLANQMGFAAVAGGVLIGSLQGVGDALGAMNKAQLDPTNKNLEAAEDALKRLSPAARDFAEAAFDLKPALVAIRDMGAEALMPGLTESLDDLERLGPDVAYIFQSIAEAAGEVAADSAASLASDRWADFFDFIGTEGPRIISDLASTVGDLTHGMAELWEALAPLNADFSSWLMDVADGFDEWATGLSATEGFTEFVDYIRETGPQVAETAGALANTVVQIVQAAAPLGGPVLEAVEVFADSLAAIADSDIGTPIMTGVAALALYQRALATTAAMQKRVDAGGGLFGVIGQRQAAGQSAFGAVKRDVESLAATWATAGARTSREQQRIAATTKSLAGNMGSLAKEAGRAATPVAGMAVLATGAADSIGLTNTISLAMAGTLAGPWGAAVGAGAGLLLDLKSANDATAASFATFEDSLKSMSLDELNAKLAETNELFSVANRVGETGGPKGETAAARAIKEQIEATKLAEIEAKGAALAFLQQTGANVDLGKWSRKSTEDIKAQAKAITEAQESANETAASFVNLGESLNDGKVSLREWIRQMANSAEALRSFTANSRTAARRGLNDGLIESLQQAGIEGARRMRQLANASDQEIERANAAWRKGQRAMKEYNDYKVPPKKVTADVSRAMQSFREVDTYLSSLDGRTATTYVNTVRTITGPKGAAVFSQNAYGDIKDRHHPEIAAGGAMRVWAEPETQGEAYIPFANDGRRPRAKKILEHTADRFGGQVLWFAGGGITNNNIGRPTAASLSIDKLSPQGQELSLEALRASIGRLTDVSERQTEAVEDQTARTDEWAQKMDDVARATTAGFNSGLFERSSNPWAPGAGAGAMFNLKKDILGLEERANIQSQLSGLGISGNALATLLADGSNADLSSLIASGQAQAAAGLIDQRAALQASVGGQGAQYAYGAQYAAADRDRLAAVAEQQKTTLAIDTLTGQVERMEKSMERGLAVAAELAAERFGAEIRGEVSKGRRDGKGRG